MWKGGACLHMDPSHTWYGLGESRKNKKKLVDLCCSYLIEVVDDVCLLQEVVLGDALQGQLRDDAQAAEAHLCVCRYAC